MPTFCINCTIPQNHILFDNQDLIEDLQLTLGEQKNVDGITQQAPNQFDIYIEGTDISAAELLIDGYLLELGLATSISEVTKTNWTQKSEELFDALRIGEIEILPIASLEQAKNNEKKNNQIYIIPGMGFGTGHHATTSSIIDLLQKPEINKNFVNTDFKTLDFGTGSGLLAIAVCHIFKHLTTKIIAIDNDAAAIENSIDNAKANKVSDKIDFKVSDQPSGTYDLVMANIYAEVLCQYSRHFLQLVCTGGMLILSGIMKDKALMVKETFGFKNWALISEQTSNGWTTLVLKRSEV